MSDRKQDQAWIENERAENLRRANGVKAIDPGGCAPPVYVGDRSRLDVAVEAGWKAAVGYDDLPDGLVAIMTANEREAVKRSILAALPILLGDPVAWISAAHLRSQVELAGGSGNWAPLIASTHANRDDSIALYAPSLGEGHE